METFIIPSTAPIPPEEDSWKEKWKKIIHSRLFIVGAVVTVLLFFSMTGSYIIVKSYVKISPSKTQQFMNTEITQTQVVSTPFSANSSSSYISPTLKITKSSNQIPTQVLTQVPLSVSAKPTTTPILPSPTTHTSSPPIMNISYPSEGQYIEFTNSNQQFCLVDIPVSNIVGLLKKHSINNGGWTSYAPPYTSCFTPNEGANIISLQYKNSYGDESGVYTRSFTFHRVQDITISINGQLYQDVNCNGSRDSGEGGISGSTTVNLFKIPEFYIYDSVTTDGSGSYSFSKVIGGNDLLSLQPISVAASGYTDKPHYTNPTVTLNSSNKSATIDIPQVPNANYSSCPN